ncbi:Cardiolipin synthase [Flagellimonas maritima]|uniref:Cardiolipin synthase n=1 Tax=Flagellimonas maritima TaxID=1383885 RepID=A0A2Z4LN21_9FLAO|nr:cardiolipin synthase [Allomuricauda aurantiaca]AWX43212.1 Cardiolipin synthase [Allomuricauda aurantiaca]
MSPTVRTILLVAYIAITLWSITVIIYYGRRPTKSISWVLAVITLPFAGPALYYLFGVNRRKFKFFSIKQFEKRQKYKSAKPDSGKDFTVSFDDIHKRKLCSLLSKNSGFEALNGNKVTILQDGEETFRTLFSAMEKANKFIHIQYYVLERGDLLEKILKILKKKVSEGVEVRIIYDSFGSFSFRGRIKKKFLEIGASIYPMMPIRFGNLLFSINFRNHRKIVIIDGEVAFTGGVNISDKYIKAEGDLGRWKDTHMCLEGPIVNDIHVVFLKDYFFASKDEEFDVKKYLTLSKNEGDVIAQVVAGGPDYRHPAVMQQYISMVNYAKTKIRVANPYFLPGEAFLQAIKIASLGGVEVSLLVPRKSDSQAALNAMFSQFEELMDVGIRIFLRDDFSHSKILAIDDEIVSIGSGNFDNRSFEHNYETNVLLYDRKISEDINSVFDKLIADAEELSLERFKERSRWRKFLEGLSKFFKPLL